MAALGVSIGARGDPEEIARSFAGEHGLTYPVLIDADNKAAEAYHVEGVPTNVVIGKDGKIRYIESGFKPEEVKQAVEAALSE